MLRIENCEITKRCIYHILCMRTADKSLQLFIFFDHFVCFVIEVEQDMNAWGANVFGKFPWNFRFGWVKISTFCLKWPLLLVLKQVRSYRILFKCKYNFIDWRCRLLLLLSSAFKFRQFRQELLGNCSRFINQKPSSFKNHLNKYFSARFTFKR